MNNAEPVRRAAAIFDEHGRIIRSIIRSHVNNDAEVDDIYQDFFLSLVHKPVPERIRDTKSYLYRALRNDVLDAARKKSSYQARIQKYARFRRQQQPDHNPADTIIRDEQMQKALELIDRELRPREAEAMIRRYACDQTVTEAAEKMGVTKRTLSRYVCVGLRKIRRITRQKEQSLHQPCSEENPYAYTGTCRNVLR